MVSVVKDKKGEIIYWWFWDGKGLTYTTELMQQQEKLPMREIMSAERFLDQLVADE